MGKKVENEEQGGANGLELAGNFGGDDAPSAPQNTAQNANEVVITSTPIVQEQPVKQGQMCQVASQNACEIVVSQPQEQPQNQNNQQWNRNRNNRFNNRREPEEEYDPYDEAELYERLFANLSKVKNKDYITDVTISCTQNEDGSWETDAKSNLELRNAILGGMLNEIAGLAEVSE